MGAARSVSRTSVSSNTFNCEPTRRASTLPRVPERTQRLDERLIRQFRADEIDRATEQDVKSRAAYASQLGEQAQGLTDAGISSDEHGRTISRSRVSRARSSS